MFVINFSKFPERMSNRINDVLLRRLTESCLTEVDGTDGFLESLT